MNILITSAGRRVSLVRAFQNELKKKYPESKVIASDSEPELSAACHVADSFFKVPRLDNPDYIDKLIEKCLEFKVGLLIPTIDTELLLLTTNKNRLERNGIIAVISSENFITKCRNKRVIHEFFKSRDINVAYEYSKEDYQLPLFIKPEDGSRSIDTYTILNNKELTEYHFTNDKLMFLEYLNHNEYDEYTCDLYYDQNHYLKCVVPRKRIEVRDGEVYKALTIKNELASYIKARLDFIEGAVGCLTAQFFMHKTTAKIYGIEINPRFGGGYPLSYLAGANFQKWLIAEYYTNEKIEDNFDCWEANLLMLRYDDEILVHGYKG
tara:strand:- start:1400 stop:2368 length:969 start_codon:yes stop_codon:yes gene_type:complete